MDNWKEVKEERPDDGEEIYAYNEQIGVQKATYYEMGDPEPKWDDGSVVTYWHSKVRPAPEPPSGGSAVTAPVEPAILAMQRTTMAIIRFGESWQQEAERILEHLQAAFHA